MITFKEYTSERPILNVLETVDVEGLGPVAAKVDSGNEAYNVIHGVDIQIEGDEVTFTSVDNKQITKPLHGTITIHIGSGVKEERPVTTFNINLHGKQYNDVTFSVADRSENTEPMLIGEPFLKSINALIDTVN